MCVQFLYIGARLNMYSRCQLYWWSKCVIDDMDCFNCFQVGGAISFLFSKFPVHVNLPKDGICLNAKVQQLSQTDFAPHTLCWALMAVTQMHPSSKNSTPLVIYSNFLQRMQLYVHHCQHILHRLTLYVHQHILHRLTRMASAIEKLTS